MKGVFFAATLLAAPCALADGREIWMGTCQACHAEALSGAPLIVGAKGTEMPARGGNPSLTDEQVKAAVDYMVSKQGESR